MTAATQTGRHRTVHEKSAIHRAAGGAVAGAALTAGLVGTAGSLAWEPPMRPRRVRHFCAINYPGQ